MNLFELFVKIGVDDQASRKLKDLSGKLGNGLKTAAKIGTAAVGAAASGISALTMASVKNYAKYEQLVGGVETLFKTSSDKVMKYAENAYKTAGMSANDYMETVTSFSASLLQSLGQDTEAAAEYADMAITDMSDNANKMGTSMEMIQNAYQGFAKANYTMLDNLKLGYGGTKSEMERLIADANRVKVANGEMADLSIESFADVTEAIHIIQTEMGITGTTASEAGKTISGSVGAMKSAWTNLVTGIADGNADIEELVNNLITTIVGDGTKNNLGVLGNIIPAVKTALNGATKLVEKLIPKIMVEIPELIDDSLPKILSAGVNIIKTILRGISSDSNQIVKTVMNVVNVLIDGIADLLPEFVVTGSLLIGKLAVGLIQAVPELLGKIPEIIYGIVHGFTSNLGEFLSIGQNIVFGIWNGISSLGSWLWDCVSGFFTGIVDGVKSVLGIHSPSRVFSGIGKNMALGVGEGWEDEFGNIKKDIDKSLNFDDVSMSVGASVQKVNANASGASSKSGVTIVQNIYSEAKTAADLMEEAIYQQEKAVYLGV